jgi:hypothetical protein
MATRRTPPIGVLSASQWVQADSDHRSPPGRTIRKPLEST